MANSFGFQNYTHRVSDNLIILNEKEVMNNQSLEGDLAHRIKMINGTLYTHTEIMNQMKEGGWNNE